MVREAYLGMALLRLIQLSLFTVRESCDRELHHEAYLGMALLRLMQLSLFTVRESSDSAALCDW
jgi:uncharacterized membrane protein YecN with MAPEG domain